jgi:hypothetical protein
VGRIVSYDSVVICVFTATGEERELRDDMEGIVELVTAGRDMAFMDEGEDLKERVFKVGELVEYWAGAYVRGYQTSGEPAFVKRVEGGGNYAIKMVGSGRGKYREVEWRQIFKDGSFNNQSEDRVTRTVRTKERMQKMAKAEAEAKYGAVLRETKRELYSAGKKQQEIEEKAEERLRRQSMEARKVNKDLTVVHKRQLDKMLEESRQGIDILREDVDEKERETRKCMRKLRQDLNAVTEQVGKEKQGQAVLDRQLFQERKKCKIFAVTG